MSEQELKPTSRKSAASVVAVGIFASRIIGFVREGAVAYFFGVGAHADVLRAAFKGPNVLQNLLGEGTISAAFIPIYSRLIDQGRGEEAGRFAGAIFGLLLAVALGLSLLGILLAEPIVAVLTYGFTDDAAKVVAGELPINRYELAVDAVRIIFPMTGFLVLSAWALGILNSHRRFFLPYFAPVLWNAAIIGTLFAVAASLLGNPFGVGTFESIETDTRTRLLFATFFGALVGGVLQFVVQLPLVFRLLRGFRFSFSTRVTGVREAMGAFGPVVAGRGVYQVSTYIDLFLGSLLAAGALSALGFAQMLYVLPVSLFGLSVAASELPELSRISSEKTSSFLRRVDRSLRQMLFMTIPTVVGYFAFGLLLVGALLQRGSFSLNDTWLVYIVLCGYSLGLLATTMSRLLQNSFYALNDTRTPAKVAVVRVVISTALAVPLMFLLDRFSVAETLGLPATDDATPLQLGAVGLSLGASLGAWIELWRLYASLYRRLEGFRLPWGSAAKMTGLALGAAVPAGLLWWLLPDWPVVVLALLVLGTFGLLYLGTAFFIDMPELEAWTGRLFRRFRRKG